jgi:hypothetical protein
MSDNPSHKLEIKITTPAELAGAQQVEEQLQRDIGKAKALGQNCDELQSKLTQVRTVIKSYHGELDVATKHVDKHVLSHSQLHKIIHSLNESVPYLGTLLQAATNPIGASVAIGITALGYFHQKIKEVNEELDRTGEENAKPLTHQMEALRENIVDSAVEAEKFKLRMQELAHAELSVAQRTQEVIEALKQQYATLASMDDARKGHELAMLELMHTAGLTSTAEYEKQKFAIEEEYAGKKRRLQEQEAAAVIAANRGAMEQANLDLHEDGGLLDRVDKLKAEKDAAKVVADDRAKSQMTQLEHYQTANRGREDYETKNKLGRNLAVFEQIFEKKLNPQETLKKAAWDNQIDIDPRDLANATVWEPWRTATVEKQYEEWAQWKEAEVTAKSLSDKAPENTARSRQALEDATAALEEATKQATDARQFITESTRENAKKQRELDAMVAANKELSNLEHDTHAAQLGAKWVETRNKLLAQPKIGADEMRDLQYINSMLGPKRTPIHPSLKRAAATQEVGDAREVASTAIDADIAANTPPTPTPAAATPSASPASDRTQVRLNQIEQALIKFAGLRMNTQDADQQAIYDRAIDRLEHEADQLQKPSASQKAGSTPQAAAHDQDGSGVSAVGTEQTSQIRQANQQVAQAVHAMGSEVRAGLASVTTQINQLTQDVANLNQRMKANRSYS